MKSQREYLTASSRCPCCDHWNVEGGAVEIDDGGAFQQVDCAACGFAWVDNYKLIGYSFEPTDAPPPSTKHPKPSMEEQLSRHLTEEEEAERRHLTDAGGGPA